MAVPQYILPIDEVALQGLILNGMEESLTLEYKASGALANNSSNKKEIVKDVSAMANAAGGLLIYGISEDPEKRYLPSRIDPVDRNAVSKEWLEQVINGIRPRIEGIEIYPVTVTGPPSGVVYVVAVPQSNTAHQATDYRYYKRFNFQVVPMEDYEVRDVMGRRSDPQIAITFDFAIENVEAAFYLPNTGIPKSHKERRLIIRAVNTGRIYAQYLIVFIKIPVSIIHKDELRRSVDEYNTQETIELSFDNTTRDVLDVDAFKTKKYGPSRFDPILPGIVKSIGKIKLVDGVESRSDLHGLEIHWSVYADNASPREGVEQLEVLLAGSEKKQTDES